MEEYSGFPPQRFNSLRVHMSDLANRSCIETQFDALAGGAELRFLPAFSFGISHIGNVITVMPFAGLIGVALLLIRKEPVDFAVGLIDGHIGHEHASF